MAWRRSGVRAPSAPLLPPDRPVDGKPFRDQLGYWLDRVAAGEESSSPAAAGRTRGSPSDDPRRGAQEPGQLARPGRLQRRRRIERSVAPGQPSARSASSAASAPPTLSSRSARASSTWRISSGFGVSGRRPRGRQRAGRGEQRERAGASAAEQTAARVLVGDRGDHRAGRGVDDVDLAAQPVALQRQPVARQAQVAELRGQLGEGGRLGLVLELLWCSAIWVPASGSVGIGVGRDEQEGLRPEPPGPTPADVDQQLVAAAARAPRRSRAAAGAGGRGWPGG